MLSLLENQGCPQVRMGAWSAEMGLDKWQGNVHRPLLSVCIPLYVLVGGVWVSSPTFPSTENKVHDVWVTGTNWLGILNQFFPESWLHEWPTTVWLCVVRDFKALHCPFTEKFV